LTGGKSIAFGRSPLAIAARTPFASGSCCSGSHAEPATRSTPHRRHRFGEPTKSLSMRADGARAACLASPAVTVLQVLTAGVAAVALAACGGAGSVGEPAVAPSGGDALASLQRQANRLLPGGPDAFRARLAALRGHPVVVNQWASWCADMRRYALDG
jgi:hypothetical protein